MSGDQGICKSIATLSKAEEPSFRTGGYDGFSFWRVACILHLECMVVGSHTVVQNINIILEICVISLKTSPRNP